MNGSSPWIWLGEQGPSWSGGLCAKDLTISNLNYQLPEAGKALVPEDQLLETVCHTYLDRPRDGQ